MFGSGAANRYLAMIQHKTGLQAQQGGRLAGWFQNLPAWTKTEMVADQMGTAMGGGGLLGGLAGFMGGGGGMVHAMTGGAFFMKHDYVIELTGSSAPCSPTR